MPRRGSAGRRRGRNMTQAGEVTVTRADGTVEVRKPYDPWTQDRIIESAKKKPLTRDEAPAASVERLNRGVRRR